ncbi:MAG: hypothetical protein RJA36_2748 [Pseudomonadota bacterium]|jgi:general secretion pathway protein J
MARPPAPARARGLTLIELLIALALLSVLALLSWRTLDGMTRAQAITQEHSDRWRGWQTALAQWDADLDAVVGTERLAPLDYDGRVLRLTRSDPDTGADEAPALRVIAWGLQTDPATGERRWARWASPPLRRSAELEQAWQQATQWGRNPGAQDRLQQTLLTPVADWQIFYHRGGAWSNPQSAEGSAGEAPATGAARLALPDGVRLRLILPATGTPGGVLTRDWARPTLTGAGQ